MDLTYIKPAAELIASDFDLMIKEDENLPLNDAYFQLKKRLIEVIIHLIDNDFEKLIRILYRLDIDENLIKRTLADNPPQKAPEVITDLIISRELQKMKTRREFRNEYHSQPSNDEDEEHW